MGRRRIDENGGGDGQKGEEKKSRQERFDHSYMFLWLSCVRGDSSKLYNVM